MSFKTVRIISLYQFLFFILDSTKMSKNNNDLDTYDAEIVEDIPEQFDLSRYRKQKSMDSMRVSSNTAPGPTPSSNFGVKTLPRYKNPNEISDNRYSYDPYNNNNNNNYGYNRIDTVIDQNFHQNSIYNPDYISLQAMQLSGLNQQQTLSKSKAQYHHHHQLPYISGAPSTPSSHIQAPIPQYPHQPQHQPQQQQAYHGSGMENYGAKNLHSTYQPSNRAFDSQNIDYTKKKHADRRTVDSHSHEQANIMTDDQKYGYSRRKMRSEDSSKSPSLGHHFSSNERKDHASEFYSKKTQFADASADSDASGFSDDNLRQPNTKSTDLGSYRSSVNTDTLTAFEPPSFALKSNLKGTKKLGVKFDEKFNEVYEVNNPHYGSEAKSEKREMKRKKKDKKKEDEILLKTKLDTKSKIQAQKAILYHVIL